MDDDDIDDHDGEMRTAGQRYWAAQALLYAGQADAVTAALGAFYCAAVGLQDLSLGDLRGEAMAMLTSG